MPKFLKFFASGLILFYTFLNISYPTNAYAATPSCDRIGIHIKTTADKVVYESEEPITLNVTFDQVAFDTLKPNVEYKIEFRDDSTLNLNRTNTQGFKGDLDKLLNTPLVFTAKLSETAIYVLDLKDQSGLVATSVCIGPTLKIIPKGFSQIECNIKIPQNIKYNDSSSTEISYTSQDPNIKYKFQVYKSTLSPDKFRLRENIDWPDANNIGTSHVAFQKELQRETSIALPKDLDVGSYTAVIKASRNDRGESLSLSYGCAVANFKISQSATSSENSDSQNAPGAGKANVQKANQQKSLQVALPMSKAAGVPCDNNAGIKTAIGCIHTDPLAFVNDLFRLAVGIGGGIAFLMMVFGAFQMVSSAGNPEGLKAGQQQFTSAIYGVLFIVFGVLLLQIIGVDILGLEGFGR